MRTTVTDKMRIFARQMEGKNGPYISYSTTMGKKKQDGTWENGRMFVEFQNGVQPPQNIGEQGVDIDVTDGWITFRNYQPTVNGKPMTDKDGKPIMRTAFGVHVKAYTPVAAPQTEIPDSFAVADEDEPW